MRHRLLERYIYQLSVLDAYHDVALTLAQGLDGHGSHPRGEDTVLGRGRASALYVPEDGDAGVELRELLLDTLGQTHGAARGRILGNEHYGRVLALAEAVVDEVGKLVDLGLHLGDYGGLGTRGDSAVQGQITCRVAHDLDEEEAFVAGSRVAQLVDGVDDGIQGRVVTDGLVGAVQIVVDGARKSYDGNVILVGEDLRARKRTVAADYDQRVDTCGLHVLVCLAAALLRTELLAAGSLEDGAALLYDVAHALRLELHDLVGDQTVVAAHDALDLITVVDGGSSDGTDGRIHTGGVAARSENTDTFDSHNSCLLKMKQTRQK